VVWDSVYAVVAYICPAKLAVSVGRGPLMVDTSPCGLLLREVAGLDIGHLLVTLIRLVKNSIAPSPVISMSPYLLLVPYKPPNENGYKKMRGDNTVNSDLSSK
jgi:hypothetical protein